MKQSDFDVIVIGGGHAGCEAAHASARMGSSVALVTMKATDLGVMSCNPAIGGLGKGHLVREIDALDGVMGRVADRSGIQFRLLNRRKGPAVQGPRAQADRELYAKAMVAEFDRQENIRVLLGEVVGLELEGDSRVIGVVLRDGSVVRARATILTSGTFLGGMIHIGHQRIPAGRMGDDASNVLADQVRELVPRIGRLKTGTPPRLLKSTIEWSAVQHQPGDDKPTLFSFLNSKPLVEQISCGITHTNLTTHDVIRRNLDRSAMYGGQIDGVGPRYCPSIEDKVIRFAEKSSHQIFLEPEGLNSPLIYPNGISTSLPADVQEEYVRTIRGLENVTIAQPGYAIEYDFADPKGLQRTLQLPNLDGLFLAGQINGTTGYEEAAAQGLVAGLNASLSVTGNAPYVFDRSQSYIGVMIDDLTTRGVSEPYRMFTSRAEYRLSLRADNADQRLTPVGVSLGLVKDDRQYAFGKKINELERIGRLMRERPAGQYVRSDDVVVQSTRSAHDLLRNADVDLEAVLDGFEDAERPDIADLRQVANDALYAVYIERQAQEVAALRRDEGVRIPADMDFRMLNSISFEIREKLSTIRPESIGQASRIEGMTPAALVSLLGAVRRRGRDVA